ncbi:MAG: AMP-binding protein [Eubacteriales bacterium]|nr:AMP-binding protein [Eubacteriales bacterium]
MKINVLEYLEKAAARMPDKIAFADQYESITYAKLADQAQRIGTFIRERGHFRNLPVAVIIDRNVKSLILFLGIVYSGNFYVPVDHTMPIQRVKLILETLQPVLILSSVKDLTWEGETPVSFDAAVSGNINKRELAEVRREALDTDPLYAIFTSGSTGVPKGVLISHRSVIDLAEQFGQTFAFPDEAVFGNQAPFDFDVSVKDIYNCLRMGGTLQVIPKQLFSFPGQLIPYLNERHVNVIIWAVSALRIVANFKTFTKSNPLFLKLVMFSGEVMPVKVLNYWREALPETQFVNLYGPTEITCNCSYYIVDRDFENEENLPIGVAFRNEEVFLLDPETNELITKSEPDRTGEICVRGTCLGLGYYNNRKKTEEVFVQNPLNRWYPEKIYKTGDLGYYSHNGELFFASRKDYQIKHMGHRIELGEIETAVNAMEFIDAACCIYDEQKEKIVLCYQALAPCEKDIIGRLSLALPKFMWPNRYEYYERLPMNKNGKLDRVFLKEKHCGNR